jgi:hypothetical protein
VFCALYVKDVLSVQDFFLEGYGVRSVKQSCATSCARQRTWTAGGELPVVEDLRPSRPLERPQI